MGKTDRPLPPRFVNTTREHLGHVIVLLPDENRVLELPPDKLAAFVREMIAKRQPRKPEP